MIYFLGLHSSPCPSFVTPIIVLKCFSIQSFKISYTKFFKFLMIVLFSSRLGMVRRPSVRREPRQPKEEMKMMERARKEKAKRERKERKERKRSETKLYPLISRGSFCLYISRKTYGRGSGFFNCLFQTGQIFFKTCFGLTFFTWCLILMFISA